MNVYLVKTGSILPLGKQGENLARKIQFDISRWIGTLGPGTVQLLHQRRGDEAPYPVAVEQEGNLAVWTVTSADTAAAGTGRAELQYYVGDALAKSETWMTKVLAALGDAIETPPEAQQGWVDQVLQAGTAAAEAADRAEEAAVHQPIVGSNGNWWTWDMNAGAYADTGIYSGGDAPFIGANGNWYVGQEDTGVSATGPAGKAATFEIVGTETLDAGQPAAVTEAEGSTAQARKYKVSIPQGPKGDPADVDETLTETGKAADAKAVGDALSGKQPTGSYITEETDPTVPAWAKAAAKPGYTADEVGADPAGTAASQVSEHNTETTSHSDMRLLIQGLTDRLNALADSDDTTLDQLSEIVAYIKSNRKLIEAITASKVSVADIIDNLTTNVANKPLSAAQGVALKAMIDAITIPTALPNPNALTFTGAVTGRYDGSEEVSVEIPSGGGGLTVTNTAAVGQTVKITAVDKNGQPTEWEAVDMASGGGGGREIYEVEFVVDVDTHEFEATLPYKSRVLGVFIKNFYSAYQATTNKSVHFTFDGTPTLGSVSGPGTEINANWRGSLTIAGFNTISFSSGSGTTGTGNATVSLPHIGSNSYNVMVRNMIEGVQKVGLIHSSSSSTIAAGTTYTVLAERVE